MDDVTVRQAEAEDHDAVVAFTEDTWTDRDVEDWLPSVFPEWVESDGDDQRTLVADVGGNVAGVCQGLLLSEYEAWVQGLRIHPEYRGRDLSLLLTDELLSWCRERGAVVARNMVFSWNDAGLGQSRASGFEPGVEGRLAGPTPDSEMALDASFEVVEDPDTAWAFWARSDAHDVLGGLGLDPTESWSLSAVTRERLQEADRVVAIQDEDGTRATTARVRRDERETDDGGERLAVYGHTAWSDPAAARALFDAVARDAAAIDADATRVLLPETPRHVSDAAAARADPDDEPVFVLEADLTGERY